MLDHDPVIQDYRAFSRSSIGLWLINGKLGVRLCSRLVDNPPSTERLRQSLLDPPARRVHVHHTTAALFASPSPARDRIGLSSASRSYHPLWLRC